MFKNLISSAANKYVVTLSDGEVKSIVLVDNCHGGRNMQEVCKLLKHLGCDIKPDKSVGDRGQGFIDESGWYHNRSESYKIAKSSGQPFNDQYTLPDNKLDSSCIRHFPEDTILSGMYSQPTSYVKQLQEELNYYKEDYYAMSYISEHLTCLGFNINKPLHIWIAEYFEEISS